MLDANGNGIVVDEELQAGNTEEVKEQIVPTGEVTTAEVIPTADDKSEVVEETKLGVLPNDADLDEFDKTLEAIKTAAKEKAANEKTEVVEPITQEGDKTPLPKEDKPESVKIDADYIGKQSEDVQEILKGMKGKRDF
ncbi:MAG: hypothetical protein ACYC56_11675, partial [Candidatus Aquicultor sp.]